MGLGFEWNNRNLSRVQGRESRMFHHFKLTGYQRLYEFESFKKRNGASDRHRRLITFASVQRTWRSRNRYLLRSRRIELLPAVMQHLPGHHSSCLFRWHWIIELPLWILDGKFYFIWINQYTHIAKALNMIEIDCLSARIKDIFFFSHFSY